MPKEVRLFAGLIMLVLAVGYAHAVAYVYETTRIVPKGIEERYRGSETPAPTTVDTLSNASAPLPSSEEAEEAAATKDSSVNQTVVKAQPGKTVTGEIEYQKSLAEMLNIIHTHVLTMTFIFALSGLITLFTRSFSNGFRKFIIIEPFIGILITFAGLWATRYLHPAFSWLVSLSGAVMAFTFAAQCVAYVREVRSK